jgi:pyruvate formate lyase activating enzyme
MLIKGRQKTTLIDYPKKIACTIFLFGCNLRCGYCQNPELVTGKKEDKPIYSEEEILDFLKERQKYLDGICITGGEPLLDIDFDFLKKIKSLDYLIKIDTNGSFPAKLKELVNEGLVDYIAMDVKGSGEKYREIVNSPADLDKIEESMRIISNFPNYEFRTTILERYHGEKEIRDMMEWMRNVCGKQRLQKYCLQGFKNSGKLLNSSFLSERDVTEEYLTLLAKIAQPYFEEVEITV